MTLLWLTCKYAEIQTVTRVRFDFELVQSFWSLLGFLLVTLFGHDFPAEARAAVGAADPQRMVGGRAEPHRGRCTSWRPRGARRAGTPGAAQGLLQHLRLRVPGV